MKREQLYSIRMRASCDNRHLSGAERIIPQNKIAQVAGELMDRALSRGCAPDQITLQVDSLGDTLPRELRSLDVVTVHVNNPEEGRALAALVLQRAGVNPESAKTAIDHLSRGASRSGENMRGAMVMDAVRGERLEHDPDRGIRVSRFDWCEDAEQEIYRKLSAIGITHFRIREALALATKVAHAPGIVAELCWSDELDYTAGYVASPDIGYVRFPHMKKQKDPRGGRVFFVKKENYHAEVFMNYLQKEPILIHDVGLCQPEIDEATFMKYGQTR